MPDETTPNGTPENGTTADSPALQATELPDTGTAVDTPEPERRRLRCHRSFAETRMGIPCITEQCVLWDEGHNCCLDRASLQAQTDYHVLRVLEMSPRPSLSGHAGSGKYRLIYCTTDADGNKIYVDEPPESPPEQEGGEDNGGREGE